MSGVSPAPRQKSRHRHSKSGSFAPSPAPAKRQDHQHQQVHHQLPHSIPQTNQPGVPRSPAMTSPPHTPRGNQKRRGRKNRPKDVETSHFPVIAEDTLSGHEGAVQIPFEHPLETPRKIAYAGPTFHSSPAPNELPVPKFLTKMPPSGLQGDMSDAVDMGLTSGSSSQSDSPPLSDGSPLDILFRADRAERDRSNSRLKNTVSSRTTEFGSPKSRNAHVYGASNSPPQKHSSQDLMFNMDHEGDFLNLTNRSVSPLAKRSTIPASSPFATWNKNASGGVDLFGGLVNNESDRRSPFLDATRPTGIENAIPSPPLFGPRPGARPSHASSESTQAADIRRMESDLRRILKLEPSLGVPQTVVN